MLRRGLSLATLLTVFFAAHGNPQEVTLEPALTNGDVVKMCKLGLGDEVVIAKIRQTSSVSFQLDTDALIRLKEQGVSNAVLEAMLDRTTATAAKQDSTGTPSIGSARASAESASDEGVWLRTAEQTVRLESVQGDQSLTYAGVVYLVFLDFPGLRAETRVTDRRPIVQVRMNKNPRGRVFLVKAKQDKGDDVRSVKVGRASMFGAKSWSTPDKDWTVECEVRETDPNVWELTPSHDLEPGEYGLLFRGGFTGILATTQAELFDFGLD